MMYRSIYAAFVLLTGLTCSSGEMKETRLELISPLANALDECSGMARLGEKWLVGHNDSGNSASLYVFTLENPELVREVKIDGAENNDWEELAEDGEFIYVGDFGNNHGKRKNLGIYIVSKEEMLKEDEVKADFIAFSYPEQTTFKKSEETDFDCEAMVCVGDSLYLFTKNHGNLRSSIYRLPKKAGRYDALLIGDFDAAGLITGADYRVYKDRPELVMIGYTNRAFGHRPFILAFDHVDPTAFSHSSFKRYVLEGQLQTESILFEKRKNVLVTSEGKKKKDRNLYRVKL